MDSLFISVVEVKRESSCSIQLGNKSDQYVAFKVRFFYGFISVALFSF